MFSIFYESVQVRHLSSDILYPLLNTFLPIKIIIDNIIKVKNHIILEQFLVFLFNNYKYVYLFIFKNNYLIDFLYFLNYFFVFILT